MCTLRTASDSKNSEAVLSVSGWTSIVRRGGEVRWIGARPEIGKTEYCGSYRLYWADGTPLALDQCPMAMTLREKRPIRGMEAICERPDGTRIALVPYPPRSSMSVEH
jgi:hypothetical protein